MRESNYIFPPQNRAVVSISQMLYDRRALDTTSPLALLNNLTSLTYLTSTSPRIREILTSDGGLERLLDILRESLLPRGYHTPPDLWGLNGPPTARIISVDRGILLKHSLAFQCVVNIGVRGTEVVRTRVVQGGALDLVAQILESWLQEKGIFIFASPFGSKAAVESFIRGDLPPEVVDESERNERDTDRRARSGSTRHVQVQNVGNGSASGGDLPTGQERITVQIPTPQGGNRSGISQFVTNLTRRNEAFDRFLGRTPRTAVPEEGESHEDVEMDGSNDVPERPVSVATTAREDGDDADVETDGNSTSVEVDDSMDMDIDQEPAAGPSGEGDLGPSTTPRASQLILPLSMTIPPPPTRSPDDLPQPQPHFTEDSVPTIARTTSENNLAGPSNAGNRSPMAAPRPANMQIDTMSTQSSPYGSPTRPDAPESSTLARRRDTITGRPPNVNLAPPRAERRERDGANSEASDVDVDLQTATINANIRALQAQAAQAQARTGLADTQDGQDADLVLAEDDDDDEGRLVQEEAFAAEQARLDMEAGAPPGQPGAAQTPRVPLQEPTPRMALLARPPPPDNLVPPEPAQIIIAAGAPRGFHDLGSYVGISSMLNPHGDCYSDDSILLALQLLAYLSKYPHVRAAFHHPRKPMHPTFDLVGDGTTKLPERPAVSRTPNIFSLVERFTFKAVYGDKTMAKIPNEIQYWAGVIMRNACRKDDAAGGVRQCANMRCGKWEKFAREFAKCRRCRKAKYCSKDCQSRAWSEGHRFWCNTRADQEMLEGHPRPPRHGNGEGDDDEDEVDLPPPPPRPTHREAGEGRDALRPLRAPAASAAAPGQLPGHARADTNPAAPPPAGQPRARTTTGRPPGWYTESVQRDGWDFDTRLPDDRQQTLLAQLQRPRRDWQDPRQRTTLVQPETGQPAQQGRTRAEMEGERVRNEDLLEHQRLNHMLQQTTDAWRAARRENTGRAMAAHAHAQQEAEAMVAAQAELRQMLSTARTTEERDAIVQRAREILRAIPRTAGEDGRGDAGGNGSGSGEGRAREGRTVRSEAQRDGRTGAQGTPGQQPDQHGRDRRTSWLAGLGLGAQQGQPGQHGGAAQGGRSGQGSGAGRRS